MDYLVRSKNWLNRSEDLVPAMTSNTTPSGVASCSSVHQNAFPAWWSFDHVIGSGNGWHSTMDMPQWLQYQFASPTIVNYVRLRTFHVVGPKESQLQASNDGSNWTIIGDFVDCNALNTWYEKAFNNTEAYTYYRLYIISSNYTSSGRQYVTFDELEFRQMSITDSQTAMEYIGDNDYASDTLLGDLDWSEAIANSNYYYYIYNVEVPVMTSATTPSGIVTSASNYSGQSYQVFDGTTSTVIVGSNPSYYIQYDFGYSVRFSAFYYQWRKDVAGGQTMPARNILIQVSDDGETWTDAGSVAMTSESAGIEVSGYAPLSFQAGSKIRIYCADVLHETNKWSYQIHKLQFYGRNL